MKVKFELEDMSGIESLTSGKVYDSKQGLIGKLRLIENDDGVEINVSMTFNCAHLNSRAAWELDK